MAESTQADFVGKEAPIGDDDDDFKDVGTTAVWMLSGAKPGNGVDQLLDGDVSFCANLNSWSFAQGADERAVLFHRYQHTGRAMVWHPTTSTFNSPAKHR